MAFTLTNKGMEYLLSNAITTSTDIRLIVFKNTPPNGATMKDWNYVQDALDSALDIATAASATWAGSVGRLDPGAVTITPSISNDNIVITTPAPVLTAVAGTETWTAVGFYIEPAAGASDTNRTLIGIDIPTPSTLTTNGQNVTLPALLLTITGSTGP